MFQGSLSLVRDRRDLMRQKNRTLQEPHPLESLMSVVKGAFPSSTDGKPSAQISPTTNVNVFSEESQPKLPPSNE